jgi:hypothetical protein
MEKKLFVLLSAVLAFAGCQQNPYPGSGKYFVDQPQKTDPAPIADIDMPPFLECEEGKTCAASIRGLFGDDSEAILSFTTTTGTFSKTIDGLPKGADFDITKKTLTYTPDFGVVDTVKDPTRTYATIAIEVTLRKAIDPVTVYKHRTLLITVRNTPSPIEIVFPDVQTAITEGTVAHSTLTINSVDYPVGPFSLLIKNAPAGVTATLKTPNSFDIAYEVPYNTVTVNDPIDPTSGKNTKMFAVEYRVVLPSGESQAVSSALTVSDTRVAPIVSYPPAITQGLTVDFTVRVDDLNGERPPVVTFPNAMPLGKLKVTDVPLKTPGIKAHLYNIVWNGIPASEAGKDFDFAFIVCGATTPTESTQCASYVTKITIAVGSK